MKFKINITQNMIFDERAGGLFFYEAEVVEMRR